MIEKRRFSRILYQAPAILSQGDKQLATCIQDLSLHGLLLWAEEKPEILDKEQPVIVEFTLFDSDVTLHMTAKIVNIQERIMRMSIVNIDIESISHLRRLVELNVGNDNLLHRDIEHLSDLGLPQ
ncbi:MAG: PilZ domain-containing protein [Vibrio sp.]